MISRSFILSACLFFLTQFLIAQSDNHELGKVTIEELQKPFSSIDSSAVAEYLFLKGSYIIDFNEEGRPVLNRVIEAKIKIYKKEGYEFANHEFPIYAGGKKEFNYITHAITYNLVNGKIEKTKLKNESEFIEKINEQYELKKITMPNVKEGSIIEFKYTMRSVYEVFSFPEWFFQKSIPICHNELKVESPVNFIYRSVFKPFLDVQKKEDVIKAPHMTFNRAVFQIDDVLPYKEEIFVSNMENYIPSVKYEIASLQYRNGEKENFSITWEDVSKRIFKENFEKELALTNYFESDLNDYLKQHQNVSKDRLLSIFTFVKERMTWNEKNQYEPKVGLKKAYKEGVGNVAEINLMLVTMLNHHGIKAFPVLVSTRKNGLPLYPTLKSFNYVIAAAQLPDGGYYLLDATSKYALPQILPLRCLNWSGRLIAEGGKSSEINLMPVRPSKSNVNSLVNIQSDGNITGKVRDTKTDYLASTYREQFSQKSTKSMMEFLEKVNHGLEVESYRVSNNDDLSKPIVEEYDFVNTNSVEIIGNKMYITPLLHFGFKLNPFKAEKRNFPVDFNFPQHHKYQISMNIPEGYVIESLPESIQATFMDDFMSFKYQVSSQVKAIQIVVSIDKNVSIVSEDFYEHLKAFFGKMTEKQSEQIVLRKL
jgi:hypothetical protein